MLSHEICTHAKVIFEYMKMDTVVEKGDVLFVPGSHDLSPAAYAAELYMQGYAKYLLVSGSQSKSNHSGQESMSQKLRKKLGVDGNEAERMRNLVVDMGVPIHAILFEDRATNSEENILYGYELLKRRGLESSHIVFIHKPYMVRRLYATLMKKRPGRLDKFVVSSAPSSFDIYRQGNIDENALIQFLVGDLDRILKYPYPPFEYQIYQEVPGEVMNAFNFLKNAGYTQRLIT